MSHKNPISSTVFADGPITRVVGGGIHPDQAKDKPLVVEVVDGSQKLNQLSALFGELLATLKVNVLRGTISINGGGIEELEKFLGSFEERFQPFKPEDKFQTIIDPNIDWKRLKF